MVAAKSRSFHIFHGLEIPRAKKKKTGWYEVYTQYPGDFVETVWLTFQTLEYVFFHDYLNQSKNPWQILVKLHVFHLWPILIIWPIGPWFLELLGRSIVLRGSIPFPPRLTGPANPFPKVIADKNP